jgi:hypothetical protein
MVHSRKTKEVEKWFETYNQYSPFYNLEYSDYHKEVKKTEKIFDKFKKGEVSESEFKKQYQKMSKEAEKIRKTLPKKIFR